MIMDPTKKQLEEELLRKIYREVPSQTLVNVTKDSYARAIQHCKTFGNGLESLWACRRTGEKQILKMTKRTIWNRDNTLNAAEIPVGVIWCPACSTAPQVKHGDPLFDDEISTLSV